MKFFSTFAALLFTSTVAQESNPKSRDLQTLAATWNIDPLTLAVDASGQLTINAPHGAGDSTTTPVFKIRYTAAATAAQDPSQACYSQIYGGGSPSWVLNDASIPSSTPANPTGGFNLITDARVIGAGTSSFTVSLDSSISSTDAYEAPAAGSQEAFVYFCVEFGLRNPGAIITFREMAVKAAITVDGTFAITAADNDYRTGFLEIAQDNDESIGAFGVYAEFCEGTSPLDPVTGYLLPGTPIPLCVCTDNYPQVEVSGYESLSYSENPGGATASIYAGGAITSNTNQQMLIEDLGCATYGTTGTKHCCRVDTILYSAFYSVENVAGGGQANLLATGSVFVSFVRRLGEVLRVELDLPSRKLNEEDESEKEFEKVIVVDFPPTREENPVMDVYSSGGNLVTVALSIMGALVSAIFLL